MTPNPWGERATQAETFRRALQPLAARVRAALDGEHGDADAVEGRSADELRRRHLLLWSSASLHVVDALQALNREVWEADAPEAAAIFRAVGRVEGVVERWLRGLDEVRDGDLGPEAEPFRELLVALYRHSLGELCDWFEQLSDTLEYPLARIPPDRLAGPDPAHVELECILNLTAPRELIEPLMPASPSDRGTNVWALAAAFGVGWMLGDDD